MKKSGRMNGIIIVNKSVGVTSRDVVNDICHIMHTKKVGHTGTLDPIASGVLVVVLGKYTKLCEYLTSEYKEYIAEMIIGYSTDTLDITGNIMCESNNIPDEDKIISVINSFTGTYLQEVPIYSSVKVNGKKLYEYARNNISVELPKRNVDIKNIEILDIHDNVVKFKCLVSKGTYIRSLIRDIGIKLNVPTVMKSLIRTKQGKFSISDAYTIEDIKNNNYKLLSLSNVLDKEDIILDDDMYKLVYNGSKLDLSISNKPYILFIYNNKDIALYKRDVNNYVMLIKIAD
jgi:tRNA pseudouridine55 synthase